LQLDRLAFELYRADFKVDADCADVGFGISVVGKTEEETGFAYARVADEQEFKEKVVFWIHWFVWNELFEKVLRTFKKK
jgi:hypothetical protein